MIVNAFEDAPLVTLAALEAELGILGQEILVEEPTSSV